MRKFYLLTAVSIFIASITAFYYFRSDKHSHRAPFIVADKEEGQEGDEKNGYDGPEARDAQEVQWMVDPSLGFVPYNKLNEALVYTHHLRDSMNNIANRGQSLLLWQERGPIY